MEMIYPLLFALPLVLAAYQDWKRRVVDDWLIVVSWVIAYLSGSQFLSLMVLIFAVVWGYALLYKRFKSFSIAWADITYIPAFCIFGLYFYAWLGNEANVPLIIIAVVALLNGKRIKEIALFPLLLFVYLIWIIILFSRLLWLF